MSFQREAEPEVEEKRPDGECVLVDPERGLTAADWERLRDGKLIGLATFDPCIAVPCLEMRERLRGHGDVRMDVLWERVMQCKDWVASERHVRNRSESCFDDSHSNRRDHPGRIVDRCQGVSFGFISISVRGFSVVVREFCLSH